MEEINVPVEKVTEEPVVEQQQQSKPQMAKFRIAMSERDIVTTKYMYHLVAPENATTEELVRMCQELTDEVRMFEKKEILAITELNAPLPISIYKDGIPIF